MNNYQRQCLLIVAIIAILIVLYYASRGTEAMGFPGAYPLGSYDPNLYGGSIVRSP